MMNKLSVVGLAVLFTTMTAACETHSEAPFGASAVTPSASASKMPTGKNKNYTPPPGVGAIEPSPGIISEHQLNIPTLLNSYHVVNAWRGTIDGHFTVVAAGSLVSDAAVSVLVVIDEDSPGPAKRYEAPSRRGALRITAVEPGPVLDLSTDSGGSYRFDMRTRGFS